MDPPVETPRETWSSMAMAAHAEPPDDPPQALSRSNGFLGISYAELAEKVPNPNSSMLVFPISFPPAARILAMDVASKTGWYPSRILDPAQVSMSMDVRLSLAENRNLDSPASVSSVMAWNMPYLALMSFSL